MPRKRVAVLPALARAPSGAHDRGSTPLEDTWMRMHHLTTTALAAPAHGPAQLALALAGARPMARSLARSSRASSTPPAPDAAVCARRPLERLARRLARAACPRTAGGNPPTLPPPPTLAGKPRRERA